MVDKKIVMVSISALKLQANYNELKVKNLFYFKREGFLATKNYNKHDISLILSKWKI